MISVRRIEPSEPLYQDERELRNRILLRPIGLPDHAWEQKDESSLHFVAVQDGVLVGCVLLWPDSETPGAAQLLQMAVDGSFQGRGVGRLMVEALVTMARERDLTRIWCHARMSVAEFYARLGFVAEGEVFQEVGLDHQVMTMEL